MSIEVQIVVNPAAGSGKGTELVEQYVKPLLDLHSIIFTYHETTAVGDGVRIGKEIAEASEGRVVLVVAGGDGTAHELIQGIRGLGTGEIKEVALVVLPTGTANALYSSLFADSSPTFDTKSAAWLDERRVPGDVRKKLGSVAALLSASNPAELPLSLVQLQTPSGIPTSPATASHVVVSTALHANLLRTADELRSEIEGVTRFKEAAQRNIGIFHSASMRFLPPNQGAVRVYSPGQRDFAPADVSSDGSVSIEGPFAYVLATTTVDRLEPDPPFLISPLVKRIPLRAGEMDVIVVRPTRDPVVLDAIQPGQIPIYGSGWDELDSSAEQRATGVWPARAMSCIGKAYGKGEHVDLVYSSAESADQDAGQHVVAEQGDEREAVVEVFRCGGWEWTPSSADVGPAHTVCIDGAIQTIPAGGSVMVSSDAEDAAGVHFTVYT